MKNNTLIAITGGIGSGKSTALEIINELGFSTISCDQITRELYDKQWFLRKVKKIFPSAISGVFVLKADKKLISKEVFSDKVKYEKLNELATKYIFKIALKRASKFSNKVFIEVPLLFENDYQHFFDYVIVIMRELDARIDSVMARSKLSKDEVLDRINSQFNYDNVGDTFFKVYNNGEKELLKKELITIINKI